jgi:hypothetical protein
VWTIPPLLKGDIIMALVCFFEANNDLPESALDENNFFVLPKVKSDVDKFNVGLRALLKIGDDKINIENLKLYIFEIDDLKLEEFLKIFKSVCQIAYLNHIELDDTKFNAAKYFFVKNNEAAFFKNFFESWLDQSIKYYEYDRNEISSLMQYELSIVSIDDFKRPIHLDFYTFSLEEILGVNNFHSSVVSKIKEQLENNKLFHTTLNYSFHIVEETDFTRGMIQAAIDLGPTEKSCNYIEKISLENFSRTFTE